MTIANESRLEELSEASKPPGWLAGALVVVVGLLVGASTSMLQTYLDAPWLSLVNAASPWLTPAFLLGAIWRRPGSAALSGLSACLLELVGYYATATARGYPVSHGIVLFWVACGVVGGPVFGAAGRLWWDAPRRLVGAGPAVLASAFFSEALVAYGWRLHYWSSAVLFAVMGAVAIVLLGLRGQQHRQIGRWLVLVIPIAVLAEFALELVYKQSF